MRVCDICQSKDKIENVSVQVATNEKRHLGSADLCPNCVASVVESVPIKLSKVTPTVPGVGGNLPQTPAREKHPAES